MKTEQDKVPNGGRPALVMPVSDLYAECGEELAEFAEVLEYKRLAPYPQAEQHTFFHSSEGTVDPLMIKMFQGEALAAFLKLHGVELFSCDLGPACPANLLIDHMYHPAADVYSRAELKAATAKSLGLLRRCFSGAIALENLNYYPTGSYKHVCEPDFISEVLAETDAYLLLDLGHAHVSARNLGVPYREFLEGMPLERVIEVHLSRARPKGDIWVDAHEAPGTEEFETLAFLHGTGRLGALQGVAIEYYRDAGTLSECYGRLRELLNTLYG